MPIQVSPPGLNSKWRNVFLNTFSAFRKLPLLATTVSYCSKCIQRLKSHLVSAEKGTTYKETHGGILAAYTGSLINWNHLTGKSCGKIAFFFDWGNKIHEGFTWTYSSSKNGTHIDLQCYWISLYRYFPETGLLPGEGESLMFEASLPNPVLPCMEGTLLFQERGMRQVLKLTASQPFPLKQHLSASLEQGQPSTPPGPG